MANKIVISVTSTIYGSVMKPLLFRIDPEKVHEHMTGFGELLGESSFAKKSFSTLFRKEYPRLKQAVDGIEFTSPIGLSAGFDYDARLTQITDAIGFGFHTVGTITRHPYQGNTRPILGRLPKSRSLMVNKGFKNSGIENIVRKLSSKKFGLPIGLSIGRTNSTQLTTHEECMSDIISSFVIAEGSEVPHAYYELNISCPNLLTPISFYEPKPLNELLQHVDVLQLSRPLYIKMPIECSDDVTMAMLKVIAQHRVQGVIFGNLQKNRRDSGLNQQEVAQFTAGNFSGKPTEKRSNELIALTFRNFPARFTIIGTGGVFSAEDAYRKIKLGASLVQLITGMIYKGPQLIAQINEGLDRLLQKDQYDHISQAIGVDTK